jgi:hypothetical protein
LTRDEPGAAGHARGLSLFTTFLRLGLSEAARRF